MPILAVYLFFGPDLIDQFRTRIMTIRLNRKQTPSRTQATDQWCENFTNLKIKTHSVTPGLRGQQEIIITPHLTPLRNDTVQ